MTTDLEVLKRITMRPDVFGGSPSFVACELTVELILSLITQWP